MGGSHRHLLVHGEGPLHRVAPQCKLAATVLFSFAVVATPKEQFWAFGVQAALVVLAAVIGRVPLLGLARHLVIEVPFLLFAVLLPIVGRNPRVDVGGLSLSEPGLWAAWNIVVKGTIGVAATVVMASTTSIPHILHGLERLRVPRQLVAITAFMIRYGDVIGDELRRMRIARESRGASASWSGHARAVATSAGALFVRSYERGERVYLAMASRGYVGTMPVRTSRSTTPAWFACLLWPLAAAVVAASAWVIQG
ncbi:MAG: cobalt ECF transporter T component CbiQ [Ilumatobacteraceae bacterium]